MARRKGLFNVSANYEPLISAPFDARIVVDYKSDLTSESTWKKVGSGIYLYDGLVVAVTKDTEANNGVYVLKHANTYQSIDGWQKLEKELISGSTIKTINGQSILGSGNINITAGSAEWGQITGDITDQTDLNNIINDINDEIDGVKVHYATAAEIEEKPELAECLIFGQPNNSNDPEEIGE